APQYRDGEDPDLPGGQRALRQDRCRGRGRHTGALRRLPEERGGPLGPRHQGSEHPGRLMARKPIRSDLAWSTPDRIVVRGKDLPGEILGKVNLGDMAFLEITGRLPNEKESRLFNAMAVTLVEHGLTPSAIAARMTFL